METKAAQAGPILDPQGKKKVSKSVRQKPGSGKKKSPIGMAPFEGYNDLAKEELRELKRMTKREALIRMEILLKAAKWMK